MMLTIPVQHDTTDPRSVVITLLPCLYCDTYEVPEDRDGLLSCPNCGYPLMQDMPLIEEWETLIADQDEPLDEAGWTHLLQLVDTTCGEEAAD
jgi:hypothetical protein